MLFRFFPQPHGPAKGRAPQKAPAAEKDAPGYLNP